MYPRFIRDMGVTLVVLIGAAAMTGSATGATNPAPERSPSRRGAVSARPTGIVGTAWNADNSPLPAARVRLRSVVTGRVPAAAIANESGQFTFKGVESGSYLIELVAEGGKLLAVGHPFTVAPGETVVTFVRLSAKAPWFEGFFGNAASAVAATAASAGVTAIAPEAKPCASPSPGCN